LRLRASLFIPLAPLLALCRCAAVSFGLALRRPPLRLGSLGVLCRCLLLLLSLVCLRLGLGGA
jgi:hypothetical protein